MFPVLYARSNVVNKQTNTYHEHIFINPIVDQNEMIPQNGNVGRWSAKGNQPQMPIHANHILEAMREGFNENGVWLVVVVVFVAFGDQRVGFFRLFFVVGWWHDDG